MRCVCVCVTLTSYFSLQCSLGHDCLCPLKSCPTESHMDKQQAGATSLCLCAYVWWRWGVWVCACVCVCVYNMWNRVQYVPPDYMSSLQISAWLRHSLEGNATWQTTSHSVDGTCCIQYLLSWRRPKPSHVFYTVDMKGTVRVCVCVLMQMHASVRACAQQCPCWMKWQQREQKKGWFGPFGVCVGGVTCP